MLISGIRWTLRPIISLSLTYIYQPNVCRQMYDYSMMLDCAYIFSPSQTGQDGEQSHVSEHIRGEGERHHV